MKKVSLILSIGAIVLFSIFLITSSCKKDVKDDTETPTAPVYTNGEGEIGPIGGTVRIDDPQSPIKGASIVIPEDALSESITFSIEQPDSNYYINGSQDHLLIDIKPSGVQFDKPVTIGIPYKSIENEEYFKAFYYDPDASMLVELDSMSLDKQNKIYYAETNHTSIYFDDEMEMDIHLVTIDYNGTTKLASYVYIRTDFEDLPTRWGYVWNGYPNALSILYSSYVPGVVSHFSIDLRVDGSSTPVSTKEIDVRINACWPSDPNGMVIIEDVTNGTPVTMISMNYVQKEIIANDWMSGEPILFIFDDFTPNNSDEYYVKAYWVQRKNNNQFTDWYRLGNDDDAETIDEMAYTVGDLNLNGILDNYEPQPGNYPPNEPSNPSPGNGAQNVSTDVVLSWNCSDPNNDLKDFDVYFGGYGNPPLVEENYTSTSYDPGDLSDNTTYHWYVVAYDDEENYTVGPLWSFTTAEAGQGPSPPTDVYAGDVNNQMGIYWQDNSNDESGFKVYRAINEVNTGYNLLGESSANHEFYPDENITLNNFHCYKVSSYNSQGESESDYTIVPRIPANVSGEEWTSSIVVSWTDPNNSQTERFYIERSLYPTGPWTEVNWVLGNSDYYHDQDVEPNIDYYYRVRSAWVGNSGFVSKSFYGGPAGPFQVSGGGGTPDADFNGNPTSGTAPLTVNFTDQSTNSPTDWQWSFGDGNTSNEQNPVHIYKSSGTYTVALTATNSYGSNVELKSGYIVVSEGGGGEPCPGMPTVTDIDGNVYNTVLLGNQCWMKENLKTTTYNDGTSIPNVTNSTSWSNLFSGAYVWYDNDISWKDKYGALYNWYTIVDPSSLCPSGWHVPTNDEWTDLTDYIGGIYSPHGNELKSCRQINSPLGGNCNTNVHPRWNNNNINWGTDDYGFSGLPGGYRYYFGTFDYIGNYGYWWSSTEYSSDFAWSRFLLYDYGYVFVDYYNERFGFSVRCLRD